MRSLLLLVAALAFAQPNPRVGFYQWESPGSSGLLSSARPRIEATGAGLLRIYLGARFDYIHPVLSPHRFEGLADPIPARILQLPWYRALLEDPALPTLVFTVYPSIDYGAGRDDINISRPWTAREERAEYDQILALSELLLGRYGNLDKTVILANTEADNRMLEIMTHTGSPELAIRNLIAWQNTRFRAVDDARHRSPRARLKLLNAFEISLVNLAIARDGHRFRITRQGRWNALRDVVPEVRYDLLSYSCYESINSPFETGNINTPAAQTGPRLARDLAIIARAARAPLMIGELGFAREIFDPLPTGGVAARLDSALAALAQARPAYVVFWQAFDAPRGRPEPYGFGLLEPGRAIPDALLRFIRSIR
jgi:hypothetical protein